MSKCCDDCVPAAAAIAGGFRRALWIALAANAVMFIVEIVASWHADSTSLFADAADFLGDAANYGISLAVLSAGAIWRSRVALAKGWTMAAYATAVLVIAAWNVWRGAMPEPLTMAWVAGLALAVNVSVAVILYTHRNGDANMRSVWLCSRNDAIGNLAVIAAAGGVFGTGSLWPDVAVALLLGTLGLAAGREVIRHASDELRDGGEQVPGSTSRDPAVR